MNTKKKKIESLTEAQRARFPEWVEKYTRIGLSCAPADQARAERGVLAHYAAANLPAPKKFVWVSSPMVLALAAPMAALLVESAPLALDLNALVAKVTSKALSPALQGEVVTAVRGVVGDLQGPASIDDGTLAAFKEAIQTNWNKYNGGAWWVSFVAWATFVRDVLGCDIPVGPREDTDSSAGWWWPHEQFVMICDRPSELHQDVEGRLHSATGPAIAWRDGWSLHFWRGTAVPQAWIERPQDLDPKLALTHENIELRRCVAEILGWEKVLNLLRPVVIDADPDPEIGTLLEVEIEGAKERFLKVRCGTGRAFVLPVEPTLSTALEANAWTYALEAGELKLEVRT